jgi:hypothetical protein
VHRPLCEQYQDGGSHITAPAASTVTAAPSASRAGAGAEAGPEPEAGAESAPEAAAEAGPERAVMPGVMTPDQVTELAAGLPALQMSRAAVLRCKAEAVRSTRERSAQLSVFCVEKWGVHWLISFLERQRPMRYR